MAKKKTTIESKFLPKKVTILSYQRESADSFTIKVDFAVKHEPGQFVQVTLPGIGEAPISICSYSDKFMELNIREVGDLTKNLAKLKVGDKLFIRGPYGKGYPMKDLKGNNVIIIGGGCGVAPLRGIIDYIEQNRADYGDVKLFLGFRTPGDILFQEKIKGWGKNFDVRISVDKLPADSCFAGPVGFVTNMVKNEQIDNKNKVVFVCGPPIMMDVVIKILKEKWFNDDQIFISAERLMHCALGLCGHCMIHGKYTCLDGPVFRWDELKECKND
ncbi:anaerobic sulfite reductase subunit B [Candidatus Woesearchaeota archaeon CG11_big_fil_rev_8_21_14_0_20_43_8]|nr:MAG: anaerobic sulfite reductase subunit B [Candidatus Woesearchaeota archaeon CG11_big_fil_rev_8_21_14_0_20_43_8]PIO05491.1 MAG: anaerobic sulfite reductase subunit AsrB [Candidatus Woesearchaeota archaeon CG08_land_8_20_14_0_20_43_7]